MYRGADRNKKKEPKAYSPYATLYHQLNTQKNHNPKPDINKFVLNLANNTLKCRSCGDYISLKKDFDRALHFNIIDKFKSRHEGCL